jgi:hypothetical protein
MDEHPAVYFRDGAGGRRPALLGTRLDVADVIGTIRQNDRYYADYGDEVDEWIDRARAIAEREEVRWRRRGEALA